MSFTKIYKNRILFSSSSGEKTLSLQELGWILPYIDKGKYTIETKYEVKYTQQGSYTVNCSVNYLNNTAGVPCLDDSDESEHEDEEIGESSVDEE